MIRSNCPNLFCQVYCLWIFLTWYKQISTWIQPRQGNSVRMKHDFTQVYLGIQMHLFIFNDIWVKGCLQVCGWLQKRSITSRSNTIMNGDLMEASKVQPSVSLLSIDLLTARDWQDGIMSRISGNKLITLSPLLLLWDVKSFPTMIPDLLLHNCTISCIIIGPK